MRVGIATVQVPFIRGGAEEHAAGLARALEGAGHEVDLITKPFRFHPTGEVLRNMREWSEDDFHCMNGYQMDRVICLKFPAYYLRHDRKAIWLLHQHRAVYDLWDTDHCRDLRESEGGPPLKALITVEDSKALRQCRTLRCNSRNVANRLKRYNGIDAQPLYHPPKLADRLYTALAEPYVFFPSRLEGLKRQELLIRALARLKTPVVALLAGDGGQRPQLERLVEELGLGHKVRLLGRITDQEMIDYYAHCLAVFYGPYDEDYGYVTLEAMLAAKPIITCTDSGGPLEFVTDGENGRVVDPTPDSVAAAIDSLYHDRRKAAEMGHAGLSRYCSVGICWDNVLGQLLA
jgi:glycosyltransferase involved in cell wall biosynthesis